MSYFPAHGAPEGLGEPKDSGGPDEDIGVSIYAYNYPMFFATFSHFAIPVRHMDI